MLTAYRADLIALGWPKWAADIEVEMLGSFLWSEVDRLRANFDEHQRVFSTPRIGVVR